MEGEKDKEFFDNTSRWAATNFAQSHAVLKTLDEYLLDFEILNNTEDLHEYLLNHTKNKKEILKINFYNKNKT